VSSADFLTQAPRYSKQEIDRRLAYELYSNALGTVYSHAIFGTLLVLLFYAKVSTPFLLLWGGILLVNVAVRMRFIVHWLKASEEERQKPWMTRMALVTSLINGVLWASTVFFLDFDALPFESLAASLMVFGLAAGAAVYAAYFIPAFYLSVVPYLGSYIVYHLLQVTYESGLIAAILSVFALMLYQQAVQLSQAHRNNIVQKLENQWLIDQLQSTNQTLEEASYTDFLTGTNNRRYFDDSLNRLWQEHMASSQSLCLIMGDIDRFKQFNDQYGHQAGDEVLKQVVKFIESHIRPTDILSRYGGEEFVVVLPHTDAHHGQELAERLRSSIEAADFRVGGTSHAITMSFGVVEGQPAKESGYEAMLDQADKLLYQSKTAGRNRVTVWHTQYGAA
jgi:diguanylate cyclase (GGDEF)-like protein